MVTIGTKSSWRLVTRDVSQRSELGPVLFNIFITDLGDGAECILTKFDDDTKQGGVAGMPVDHAAIQKDLNRLEKGVDRILMQFNKGRYEVLYLGRSKPMN